MPRFVPLAAALALSAACSGIRSEAPPAASADAYPTAVVASGSDEPAPQPGVAVRTPQARQPLPVIALERINAGIPWPRGLAFVEGKLVVVARGRHRNYGGPSQEYEDHGGCLYEVDPRIFEPYEPGRIPSVAIIGNQKLLAEPDASIVHVFDRSRPPLENRLMNRPYCTLVYDPPSRNVFFCAFSGVDMSVAPHFRKNATDALYRFDLRTNRWGIVEMHRDDVVPPSARGPVISNVYYPHHDPSTNPPPHGLLNGPNGCAVVGHWLYAVGKDNHTLARYDLGRLREDPDAPPPPAEKVLGDRVQVRIAGKVETIPVLGHSAVAAQGGWLYLATRTNSLLLRFPIDDEGILIEPIVGELIGEFEPWDPAAERSADVWDIGVNRKGEVFVSCARSGRVWKVEPDPQRPFDGNDLRKDPPCPNRPYLDGPQLTGAKNARISNLAFDEQDRMVFCITFSEAHTDRAGGIFRVIERAP